MNIRPTQASISAQIQSGLFHNLSDLVQAQSQIASGKRIQRPSDDPVGSALALSFRRALEASERYRASIQSGRTLVDTGAARLGEASGLLTEARELLIQGLNGTLNGEDRALLATQVSLIRDQMLGVANAQTHGRYLFAGTVTEAAPFAEESAQGTTGGEPPVTYRGNGESQELLVGAETRIQTTLGGEQIFALQDPSGIAFAGLTGIAAGTSANQGTGWLDLQLRHDATSGALGGGLAFAAGGANDTLLGDHQLVVDATAGTVQLGSGPAVRIPQPGDPDLADFTVTSAGGAELHLDFSAYTGVDVNAAVHGDGSISLDGTSFTPLTFTETDLELVDPTSGRVLHVDTTAVHRAGPELVQFGGTIGVFELLAGIAGDLNNVQGLSADELSQRLGMWLGELDRNQQNVLQATGVLGANGQRLVRMEEGLLLSEVETHGLLSGIEDADFSQVVLDMTRAEQTLELAQATSVRLLSTSLLNFLR
jgi:flagellar hook-associated protein 3 FlgL